MNTVLSFDVDRTLVDRDRHSHFIPSRIKEALHEAADSPHVAVVLNTGRDLGALREVDIEVGREFDALFLSGRGERCDRRITVKEDAILSPEIIARLFDKSKELEIPFLDVKTGSGVVHVSFSETSLPLGFQKPRDWYTNYRPSILDGNREGAFAELNELKPLRLEIPFSTHVIDNLYRELTFPGDLSLQILPAHRDYVIAGGEWIGDWQILQVISPINEHNKGTSLRDFIRRLKGDVKVIHFGDSSEGHNSDTLVGAVLPRSEYVKIDWRENGHDAVERLIVATIERHL